DLSQKMREVEEREPSKLRDKERRELAKKLLQNESKLESARTDLRRALLAKKYIDVLPSDCFQVMAWVIGAVVVAVALKGCFDFGQDSLVGSVVNLSLFDLRNRFYRKAIHLDVDHFGEQGTSELMARFTNDM